MNTWSVAQGLDATFVVTIVDTTGAPITTYLGTETLAGKVWPGDDQATTFALAPAWVDATAGTVSVGIAAAHTAALGEGNYRVVMTLFDGTSTLDFFEGVLEITEAPGTALVQPTYCTYEDMLNLAPWIGDIQALMQDQSGFAQQRAAARVRLDSLILHSYRGHTIGMFGRHSDMAFAWAYGAGPRRSILTSKIVRDWLAANYLMVRDSVKRFQAHWAIADVCMAQMGRGNQYISYGAWHRNEGDKLAAATTCELDLNNDGLGEVGIALGSTNTLFT